jgi:dienelactone hydrolase
LTYAARLAIAGLLLHLAGPTQAAETAMSVGVHQNVAATLIAPDGPGPYAGVLVLESSRGISAADFAYARALMQEGYVCLVPNYLEAYGDTSERRQASFTTDADRIAADLANAADILAHTDKVRGGKIGAVGFSNGGFFATYLAGTHKVSAAVSYYGALTGAGTNRGLARFQAMFTAASAPLLLMVGTRDSYYQPTRRLVDILRHAGSPVQVQFFEDVHHEFERAPQNAADRTATTEAWKRTLGFFTAALKSE